MKKTTLLLSLMLTATMVAIAQIPPNYYDNAIGKRGIVMQQALHNIIDNHNVQSYSSLHNHYKTTDKKPNGKVWDMYSDIPGGTPPYEFTFISDKCGNYQNEGDCYNREHSFPQSWFSSSSPMKSDLFHVYPTDGKVNGMRSSYPYGEVSNPTKTSLNGSKLGPNTTAGYSGKVFEPIDAYKGDFARTYFYMATRYYGEDGSWNTNAMTNGAQPKTWALNMLYQWHLQDTVSQKEISRNNVVYGIQNNRNPFIDHPEWVDSIWFDDTSLENKAQILQASIYPNPTNSFINIKIKTIGTDNYRISINDLSGRRLLYFDNYKNNKQIDISDLAVGVYIINISNQNSENKTLKLIKQ